MLHAEKLAKRVTSGERTLTILHDLSLSVAAGESVAILGKSGAGKSTLLGLLAGLDTPSDGELTLFGHALSRLDEDGRAALRAGRVGFVFQNFQLLPTLSALENVLLPLELSPRAGETRTAQQWLERVGLGERTSHQPKQLSGGEQQRVAIARMILKRPDIRAGGRGERGWEHSERDRLLYTGCKQIHQIYIAPNTHPTAPPAKGGKREHLAPVEGRGEIGH